MVDESDDIKTVAVGTVLPDLSNIGGVFTLVVHSRDGVHVVPLPGGRPVVIGRTKPSDLVLQEARLSREHVRFSNVDGVVWVEDLGSTNGTVVNGKRIQREALGAADRVILPGVTVFVHTDRLAPTTNSAEDLHREAEAARSIQERLVGPTDVVDRGPLQLCGLYRPASICSGDFWNYFDLGAGRTLVTVGDVTGHGMSAAMLTAAAKGCCDTLLSTYGAQMSLTTLMETLNDVICQVGRGHQAMTLFASVVDTDQRKMWFSNAGHPAPFLCRKQQGNYGLRAVAAIGSRLGDQERQRFQVHEIDLVHDDVLLWYTDGLLLGDDAISLFRGEKRIREALVQRAHLPVQQVRDGFVEAVFQDRKDDPLEDDITLVVGKIQFD